MKLLSRLFRKRPKDTDYQTNQSDFIPDHKDVHDRLETDINEIEIDIDELRRRQDKLERQLFVQIQARAHASGRNRAVPVAEGPLDGVNRSN